MQNGNSKQVYCPSRSCVKNKSVHNQISEQLLQKYFSLTGEALEKVKQSPHCADREKEALDFLDMAQRYYDDALHFYKKGEYVLAYGAVYYAHAWLDAGARLGLFKVKDSRLFVVDD